MPYIRSENREKFEELLAVFQQLDADYGLVSGDLNYVFTRIIHLILEHHGMSYTRINSLIGVLECCKLELYRRVASPYEDNAIDRNGDVV